MGCKRPMAIFLAALAGLLTGLGEASAGSFRGRVFDLGTDALIVEEAITIRVYLGSDATGRLLAEVQSDASNGTFSVTVPGSTNADPEKAVSLFFYRAANLTAPAAMVLRLNRDTNRTQEFDVLVGPPPP